MQRQTRYTHDCGYFIWTAHVWIQTHPWTRLDDFVVLPRRTIDSLSCTQPLVIQKKIQLLQY